MPRDPSRMERKRGFVSIKRRAGEVRDMPRERGIEKEAARERECEGKEDTDR